jgi:hypothetical protein
MFAFVGEARVANAAQLTKVAVKCMEITGSERLNAIYNVRANTPYSYRLLTLKGNFTAHIGFSGDFRLGTLGLSPKQPIGHYDYSARALLLLCQRCGFATVTYNL